MKEVINGVVGTYHPDLIEEIEEALFEGCDVKSTSKTPLEYNGKNAIVIGFELKDALCFPKLLTQYHGNKEKYELNLTVFVGSKKVDLEALR